MISLNLLMAVSLSSLNLLASAQAPIQPDPNMPEGYQPGMATVCNIQPIIRSHTIPESLLIPSLAPTARPRTRRPAKHLHHQLPHSRQPLHQHLGTSPSAPRRLRRRHQRRARRRSGRLCAMWQLLQHHFERHSILQSRQPGSQRSSLQVSLKQTS